jgi:hypothetical protein
VTTVDKHARHLGSRSMGSSRDARPQLLLELQPAYRVFFSNLFDILLFRTVRRGRVAITSPPGSFWPDVFIHSTTPWWGLMESTLWHVIMIGAVLILWRDRPLEQARFQRTYEPTVYYEPSPTYPVEGSRRPPEPAVSKQVRDPTPSPMQVARERTQSQGLAAPPDIRSNQSGSPNAAGSNPLLPAVPLSATARSQLNVPAGPTSVVAPAPDVNQATGQATARRPGLLQAAVIPPAPDVATVSGRRGGTGTAPSATVIGPPPTLQGSGRGVGGSNINVDIGPAQVVGPSPQLPMHDQRVGSGMQQGVLGGAGGLAVPPAPSVGGSGNIAGGRIGALPGGGVRVVPPPPSVQGAGVGNSTGGGRASSFSGTGVQAVPPAPSLTGSGDVGRGGVVGSLSGVGMQAVPPPPSLGNGGSGAAGSGGGRVGALSGTGMEAVPPPPSGLGAGGSGGGRIGSLSGTGLHVVPPPPSGLGPGGAGGGRIGSLSGAGMQVVPPAPSGFGAGGSGNGRIGSLSGNGAQVVPPPPSGLGAGGSGSGRLGSLSGDGSEVVPPPPSGLGGNGSGSGRVGALASADVQGLPPPPGGGAGNSAGGGDLAAAGNSIGSGAPGSAPSPKDKPNYPDTEEMPVRLIGLALALPGSSYFSNYEVFIAERRLSADEAQFIKLVYISLPYQRRLADYNPSHVKVYKLRVTRDPTCDETVHQVALSQAEDAQPGSPYASALADLSAIDPNSKLPCYRTTADDYRRALTRSR